MYAFLSRHCSGTEVILPLSFARIRVGLTASRGEKFIALYHLFWDWKNSYLKLRNYARDEIHTFASNTRRPVLRIWIDNLVFLGRYERNRR